MILSTNHGDWNPHFTDLSPLFNPIKHLAEIFSDSQTDNWPSLSDYQKMMLDHAGKNHSNFGAPLHFVMQSKKPAHFKQRYEPRIYLKGEIQTRTQNWHDFFQAMIWCLFPKTKIWLNALHYQAAEQRNASKYSSPNRSPLENFIALFDECGVIICSSNTELLNLIRNFQWKELFWYRREELKKELQCVVFGHALYEKALHPYIGMTGNALLIDVDESFRTLSQQQQSSLLDKKISHFSNHSETNLNPGNLTPFPLLGMPGWDKNNNNIAYYDNKYYFRNKEKVSS